MSSQREREDDQGETNTVYASDVPHLWSSHRGCRQERKTPSSLDKWSETGHRHDTTLVTSTPQRGPAHVPASSGSVFLHQINATRTQGVTLISATGSLMRRNTSEGLKTCISKRCILYRRTTLLYRGILASGELGVEGVWV